MLWFKKKRNKGPAEGAKSFLLDPENIPRHVAIIMDGNGRWATSKRLPRAMGHRKGAEVLRHIVRAADDLGIKALTVYGFSTENWKRPDEEVALLMELIKEYLRTYVAEMDANGVRIRFIGAMKALSQELQGLIIDAESLTAQNEGITLNLAINYGGRDEIIRAMKRWGQDLLDGKQTVEGMTEEAFAPYLDTGEFHDVDLLIRPSGDYRISNFLLWQLAYAEFWFTDKNWPDFDRAVLEEAIAAFQQRERRFGGLKED